MKRGSLVSYRLRYTHYGGSITHVTKDQNVKINYIQSYGGVVYFKDFNNDTGRNAVSRASDGMGLTTDSNIETEYKLIINMEKCVCIW